MRILYSAIDQTVPAAHGGSVHVRSVADGLSALGHEVHVLASPGDHGALPSGPAVWWAMSPPLGDRRLRLLRAGDVLRRARAFRPDVIIERYYNLGGEGLLAARKTGALAVLEVNAPVVDYPGSPKQWLDRLMIVQPLRRWRDWQCHAADLIVTPSRRILPAHVPSSHVLQSEWGADTDRFQPCADHRHDSDLASSPRATVVFVGAFRPWHGAIHLVEAMRALRAKGRRDINAVLVGDGPEMRNVRQAAQGLGTVAFTGALAHEKVPAVLAAADIGVAPFDVAAHPPLQHEFHWSPLKVFEYMATGLPVVVPKIDRLAEIVRDGREGLVYDSANPEGLAAAIERLADDAALRRRLGAAARARAVERFSWRSHCQALDRAMRAARDAHLNHN
jgi:glycosyltransferase involved in cell wall biosynthesis